MFVLTALLPISVSAQTPSDAARLVRGIRIASGDRPRETRPVVWLQARQHAWESGSSWVARGIGEWFAGDSPDAIKLP